MCEMSVVFKEHEHKNFFVLQYKYFSVFSLNFLQLIVTNSRIFVLSKTTIIFSPDVDSWST